MSALRVADAGIIVCAAKGGLSVGAERAWKYLADYFEDEMVFYLRDQLVCGDKGIFRRIMDGGQEERDLYLTGEYVSRDEITTHEYINSLDEDEIVNAKMTKNEAKYPVEKARGRSDKYDLL